MCTTPTRTRYLETSLLVLATAVAFGAQYLFTGEWFTRFRDTDKWNWPPVYTLACVGLLCSVACAALAAWGAPGPALAEAAAASPARALTRRGRALLATAVGAWLASLLLYLLIGEGLAVQGLWVGGALLFGAAVVERPRDAPEAAALPARALLEWATVGLTTLAGLLLRSWELGELPFHIDNDIPLVGVAALDAVQRGDYRWVGFSESGHLQSYEQFYAWSLRLFGADHAGLVMTSVISGTLTIPMVYLLGRELFHPRVGLVAMLLLAGSYTHIHFSRTLFGPKVTLLAVAAVYCVLMGLRRRQERWFGAAGLITGVGLLLYDSARVVPLIGTAVLAWWIVWRGRSSVAGLRSLGWYALGSAIAFGPMLAYAATHTQRFMGRGNDVTIWSPRVLEHARAAYHVSGLGEVLWTQTVRTFLTVYLYGDSSPQFGLQRPIVSALTASLMTIGVGLCVARLRDARSFALLAWIGLTFVLGGVLTYDPPFWPHLNIALPAIMLLAGLGAHTLVEAWPRGRAALAGRATHALLLAAVLATSYTNWQVYYGFAQNNAGPRERMARAMSCLTPGYRVFLVSDAYAPDMFAFRFYNRQVTFEPTPAGALPDALPDAGAPLLFVLDRHDELIPRLRERYPDAAVREHVDAIGAPQFVTVQVDRSGQPAPLCDDPLP